MEKDNDDHSFDNTYQNNTEMFGHPYKELQDYFTKYSKRGTLLDLGCGQGRDAIFLSSLGYQVTTVDSSKIGVDQMISTTNEQGLEIHGIVADVLELRLDDTFDIILFDMLLHSFEGPQQFNLLKKYSRILHDDGIMCIVFPSDLTTAYFMDMFNSLDNDWKLLEEITIRDVPKIEGEDDVLTFTMIVVQRVS